MNIPDGTTELGYGHDGYSVTVANGMVTIRTPKAISTCAVDQLPWQLLDAQRREDQLREACEEQYRELERLRRAVSGPDLPTIRDAR